MSFALKALSLIGLPYLASRPKHFAFLGLWEDPQLKRNSISQRVFVTQYAANKTIEDRFDYRQLDGGYAVAVYDGHGGYQVSEMASKKLLSIVQKEIQGKSQTDLKQGLKKAFSRVQQEFKALALKLYRSGFGGAGKVGTCALVAGIWDNILITANAGDSRALIIQQPQGHTQVNTQHNAREPSQQARLKALFPDDQDIVVCKRSNSCYVKGRLQPTRSLGDFHLKYQQFNNPQKHHRSKGFPPQLKSFKGNYVSPQPQLFMFKLSSKDRFLILASDGLWDELSNYEVSAVARQNAYRPKEIPKLLIEQALRHASERTKVSVDDLKKISQGARRKLHDDITVVLVDLKYQG